jgi:hypothetical protein
MEVNPYYFACFSFRLLVALRGSCSSLRPWAALRPPAVSGRLVSKKPASGKGDGPSLDLGGGGLALAGCLDAQAQFAAHAKGGADTEEGKWGGYLSTSLAKGILDVVDNPIGVGLHIPILPDV